MKRLKRIALLLCSTFALSLIFSCSNGDSSDSDSDSEKKPVSKVEIGTEYKTSSGTQVYRMVTKRPNLSTVGNMVKVWYYDEKDELVYYSEEDTEYYTNAQSGEYSEGTQISYKDEEKTVVFGKQVSTFGSTDTCDYILDEDYDGNGNKHSARIETYKYDEDTELFYYVECDYDPTKTEYNVLNYREGKQGLDFHDIEATDFYAENLTWDPVSMVASGNFYPEKVTTYLYDEEKTVDGGLFSQPLCIGYITKINDYEKVKDPTVNPTLLHTTYKKTEYRWNTALYDAGPLEEISYNLEYDEDTDSYKTVEQCGYKIITVESYDGEMLPVQEIWFTAEGNIQHKYTYDYDVETTDELLPEEIIEKFGHLHYMTKKNYYLNSSSGLFLAESSEFLHYNAGDNKEYRYEVEVHKRYDNM